MLPVTVEIVDNQHHTDSLLKAERLYKALQQFKDQDGYAELTWWSDPEWNNTNKSVYLQAMCWSGNRQSGNVDVSGYNCLRIYCKLNLFIYLGKYCGYSSHKEWAVKAIWPLKKV